jgi:hypothetical protein
MIRSGVTTPAKSCARLSQITVNDWQQSKAGRQALSKPTAAERGGDSQPLQGLPRTAYTRLRTPTILQSKLLREKVER